jgi:outer membrane protein OmpA-like peptidoglycan-associated protein
MDWKMNLKTAVLASAFLALQGCATDYVLNKEESGPIFVKAKVPTPVPEPEPEPEPVIPTVNELNEKAVAAFDELGFEAEVIDKGVIIYLPPTIYFQGSESSINLAARTKIAEIAQELKQPYLASRIIEITGHTDSVGDPALNLLLSKDRSLAATEELVFSGISKTRITNVWLGETQPRASEFNLDGSVNHENRNLNRRVEFIVLNPE